MDELIVLLIVVIVFGSILKSLKPQIKGRIGEATTSSILGTLPQSEYRVLNDVMFKTQRGMTQIDHVVVSEYGIFVIETKNFKGWITGGQNSEQWTKNMYGKKYPFRNPIKQNYSHIYALCDLLDLPMNCFVSIVVFSSNAKLKVQTTSPVVYMKNLRKAIYSYREKRIELSKVVAIEQTILDAKINSKENKSEHIKHIRQNQRDNSKKIKAGICPRCGGNLVMRNGKYGKFRGCSSYPKCRFTSDK